MFRTAELTQAEIDTLSPFLKEQYELLKSDTEGFDKDFYQKAVKENDDLLFEKIQEELSAAKAKKETGKPAKKVEVVKQTPSKAAKYKVGDTFYRANGAKVIIESMKPRGKGFMYKMSDRANSIKEASVNQLLTEKPIVTKKEAPVIKKETPAKVDASIKTDFPDKITWREKLPIEHYDKLNNVINAQTFRSYTANKKIEVDVKVVANVGDVILINEDGFPTKVMTAGMADKHLVQGIFKDTYVRVETAKEKDAKIALLSKELEKVTGKKDRAEKLFVRSNAAKRAARTKNANAKKKEGSKKVEVIKPTFIESILGIEPAKKEQSKPKKVVKKEVEKVAKKPVEKPTKKVAATKPKERGCLPAEYEAAEIIAVIVKFLETNAAAFNSIWTGAYWSNQNEIEGVFKTKGDNQKIIVRIKEHSAIRFTSPEFWYSLCLESWKLTKIEAPKKGSYAVVINKKQLREIYTTKGTAQWEKCLKLYADVIACQKDGNCNADDKAKWKAIWENCGNLGKKLQVLPDRMRILHKRAKSIKLKRSDIRYSDAISLGAKELREEEAKAAA